MLEHVNKNKRSKEIMNPIGKGKKKKEKQRGALLCQKRQNGIWVQGTSIWSITFWKGFI